MISLERDCKKGLEKKGCGIMGVKAGKMLHRYLPW